MNILIFTVNTVPTGQAGSLRLYTFAQIFKSLGHNPIIAGNGEFCNYEIFEYNEISFVTLKPNYYLKSVQELFSVLSIKVDLIFIYWIPLNAFLWLKKFAIHNKIKLIHDSVEWYSIFQYGPLYRGYYEKNIVNRFIVDNNFKVIAISRFLERYYCKKGISVIRIPVLMDVNSISHTKRLPDDKIVLMYAGMPTAKKDKLDDIIKALMLLSDDELNKIEINLIGLTNADLDKLVPFDFSRVKKSVNVLGKISREEVLMQLSRAHFTFLVRYAHLRYAKAGFPTKFVESLATGTPVILNLSSDLANYANTENAFIIDDSSPHGLCNVLRTIMNLSQEELVTMQDNARKTAEKYFDYRHYIGLVSAFLS